MTASAAAIVTGYVADLAFGDPRRFHPVAGFGQVAERFEQAIYAPTRLRGALYAGVLVGLSGLGAARAARLGPSPAVLAVVTWAALGGRSLTREARAIAELVSRGELEAARRELPKLVGRDPSTLDEEGLSRALVESVAENTSDAVVGALLWATVAGPAGVAAFRAANTLDAMVGRRDDRYERFGWAAARLDDAMCWPAARLAAALAVLCAPVVGGSPGRTWTALRRDGAAHPSPNAGRLEAAFAGALDVRLGGTLAYAGRVEHRPVLGSGRPPAPADVARAAKLSGVVALAAAALCASLSWAIARRAGR